MPEWKGALSLPLFDPLPLVTPRLELRPLRPADADALFSVYSDPVATRYWSSAAWTTPEQAVERIELDRLLFEEGSALRLALQPRGEPAIIGTVSLFAFDTQSQRAELGYILAPFAWGRGLMHEALQALVDHAFGPLALRRLEADIDPRNERSARTLERLGFTPEGHLRERWVVAGEVSDSALYGLLAREWPARRDDAAARRHGPVGEFELGR